MATSWRDLPRLPGYTGAVAYAALPTFATALHRASGLAQPPFDPIRLAAAIGVTVQRVQTYTGNRGLLVPLRDGYRILVCGAETPGAQRFTVAHELIELGLQIGCPALVERGHGDAPSRQAKERYCETGAAEILMPLDQVRRAMVDRQPHIGQLLALSDHFGASLHATLRRMVDATDVPCVGLIVHEKEWVPGAGGVPRRPRLMQERPAQLIAETRQPGYDVPLNSHPHRNPGARLQVTMARGGGGLVAGISGEATVAEDSILVRCHASGSAVQNVEHVELGRLRGTFRIEAICPGRSRQRHVYALLFPQN